MLVDGRPAEEPASVSAGDEHATRQNRLSEKRVAPQPRFQKPIEWLIWWVLLVRQHQMKEVLLHVLPVGQKPPHDRERTPVTAPMP